MNTLIDFIEFQKEEIKKLRKQLNDCEKDTIHFMKLYMKEKGERK